jgi:tripeptidyl-peptidase-1
VQELVAPAREAQQAVKGWLRAAGVSPRQMRASSNGDFVAGLVPAGTLERMLGAQLFYFHCGTAANATAIRTARPPRLPTHVQEVVDFVVPAARLPAVGRLKQQRAPTPTKEDVSPHMLRSLYNISARGGKAAASQAVASFLHEYFSPSDLAAFQQQFSPESLGATPKVVGGNVAASPTLEAR